MKRWLVGLSLVAVGVALAGCASDSGDGGEVAATADPDEGQTFSRTVSALQGGAVETKSGGAMIQIPAEALAQDTEITVAVEPKDTKTAASVYDFGPDGTTFTKVATLAIAYDGDPGEGKKAVLGMKENKQGAQWVEVPGSKASGDMVSGKVAHFTRFSVIVVDDEVRFEASCEDAPSQFEPCGEAEGSLAGTTWEFQDMCMQGGMPMENPMAGICAGASMEADVEISGTVNFGSDGMMTEQMGDMAATVTMNLPLDCLADLGGISCADLSSVMGSGDPTGGEMLMQCRQSGAYCACSASSSESMGDAGLSGGSMPYEVRGTQLIITNPDGFEDAVSFCLRGDTLMVEPPAEADLTMSGFMILSRQ